jgi:hypothetical protein
MKARFAAMKSPPKETKGKERPISTKTPKLVLNTMEYEPITEFEPDEPPTRKVAELNRQKVVAKEKAFIRKALEGDATRRVLETGQYYTIVQEFVGPEAHEVQKQLTEEILHCREVLLRMWLSAEFLTAWELTLEKMKAEREALVVKGSNYIKPDEERLALAASATQDEAKAAEALLAHLPCPEGGDYPLPESHLEPIESASIQCTTINPPQIPTPPKEQALADGMDDFL